MCRERYAVSLYQHPCPYCEGKIPGCDHQRRAVDASAPAGHGCADCAINGYACPACVIANLRRLEATSEVYGPQALRLVSERDAAIKRAEDAEDRFRRFVDATRRDDH
jgi:hypothetical protein